MAADLKFHPSEKERVAALHSYGILDTEFEETYDRMTRLAADLFDAPASAISLIDLTRQWLKSRTDDGPRETSRETAFCDHAIRQSGVFVVPDATTDPRFSNNPFVTGDPMIRFYAGAPLICPEGFALGTICIYDLKPRRQFEQSARERLADFSGVVMDLLNARRRALAAGHELTRLRGAVDKIIGQMRF
jgi:GAF domain-containing protein